ncbi:MAG: Protein kinase protein, partial [Anaerolineales bacterium]|nr:Protein kinase protein [Anaerolineales bacterium]
MTETVPLDFPGYVVQALAGRGGMGRVYRAEQLATRRLVAIKLLTAGRVDPQSLATFRREASTLAQLEHPHIVPLYDYGEHDGSPYLVVRFLSGGTVADRLKSGPIDVQTSVRWIADVADALDAAHRRGITHRDVKPSNLLLDEAGNVYLGDFGIAATTVDLAAASHSGSAAYASPEQARGGAPDARSDVYSLAVTAFEMVTGKKPYEAETALGMMVRHMHDPVPSARAIAPALAGGLDAAIASGMAKDPKDRPASAGAFARSLLADTGAAPADRDSATLAATPSRSPSRGLLVGLVVLAGAACLAGVGIFGGGLAVYFAVATPTAPPTQVVAPADTAAPTIEVAGPSLPFTDDFSDPSSGFGVEQDEDGRVAYVDGTLQIEILTPGIEWFSPHKSVAERDLVIEVEARVLEGPPGSEIGVVCRWQDEDNYVAAALRNDGMVSLWKMSAGVDVRLMEWTAI